MSRTGQGFGAGTSHYHFPRKPPEYFLFRMSSAQLPPKSRMGPPTAIPFVTKPLTKAFSCLSCQGLLLAQVPMVGSRGSAAWQKALGLCSQMVLASGFILSAHWLCDLGQVTSFLCASISSSGKGDICIWLCRISGGFRGHGHMLSVRHTAGA